MPQPYVIQRGDTMGKIAERFLGDAALYGKLASYNRLADPNAVAVGQTIDIPSRAELDGPPPVPPPARTVTMPRISVKYQLSADNYTHELTEKTMIVLHHTVGGSAFSTFKYWQEDVPAPGQAPKRSTVATPFLIDRDGAVYQVYDPHYWSYHLGIKDLERGQLDRRSIGIELASEGALVQKDGKLLAFYDDKTGKGILVKDPFYDHGVAWRGHRFFDEYERAQIEALIQLCEYLFLVFPAIPRRTPINHIEFNRKLYQFNGVIGHHQVRTDKTDVHPNFPWIEFCSRLGIEQVPVA